MGNRIENKKLNFNLYGKRDNFLVLMLRTPCLTRNIPSKMFSPAFETKILRTAHKYFPKHLKI